MCHQSRRARSPFHYLHCAPRGMSRAGKPAAWAATSVMAARKAGMASAAVAARLVVAREALAALAALAGVEAEALKAATSGSIRRR